MDEIDPYRVFNVPRQGFDIEVVKQKYRRLARKLHPDKNPNDAMAAQLFMGIQMCYQRLLEDHVARLSDRPCHELREEARGFMQRQAPQPDMASSAGAASMPNNKFDVARFNRLFDKHRVEDAYDDGYGEWMKTAPAEPGRQPSAAQQRQVQVHRPQALTMTGAATYELGLTRVTDYSKPCSIDIASVAGRKGRSVEYTDYRVAHTTHRLVDGDPEAIARVRPTYDTVQQLEAARADVPVTMTREESVQYAMERRREARREAKRKEALDVRDRVATERYDRMHMLLTGGR